MRAGNSFDAQLIAMASSTKFTELYEKYYAAVYFTALRITGNRADAEDALQTVFLRILSQGGRLDTAQAPEPYLRRAAANAAVDLLRRRISHGETMLEEDSATAARDKDTLLLKEQLRRAIAALERSDAILFLLRYVEGMSNGELAEMFGREKNHIAVRLHRIRQILQTEIGR